MPSHVSWYLEKRVILAILDGDMTLEASYAVSDSVAQHLEQGLAPVHLVVDTTTLGKYPNSLKEIRNVSSRYMANPNLGRIVVVSAANPVTRFIASTLTQLAGIRLRLVDTLDEALMTLKQVDETLADVLPL
jgi:hypothetical protein